jgi:hypothetical protein
MKCLDGMNRGGWGRIYSHQPLPSHCLLYANRWSGWSAPAHQRLKSQRLAVTSVSTATGALNALSDVK